jgi:hypothetical protein
MLNLLSFKIPNSTQSLLLLLLFCSFSFFFSSSSSSFYLFVIIKQNQFNTYIILNSYIMRSCNYFKLFLILFCILIVLPIIEMNLLEQQTIMDL